MLLPFGYYDLIEAFSQTGCAVCRLVKRDVQRHIDAILYEYVTDAGMYHAFRASRGLCHQHGQLLMGYGNALGIATLYEAVLDQLVTLAGNAPISGGLSRLLSKPNGQAMADMLAPDQPCIACQTQADSEARYADILGEYIDDDQLQQAYRQSDGLCLSHIRQALTRSKTNDNAKILLTIQTDIWDKLRAELAEFRRKYDFQHVDEAMGTEGDSWMRAVRMIGGDL